MGKAGSRDSETIPGVLVQLAETFDSWKQEIARMWRYTRNNAITEGFHTKMEMIQRRAYGFRNFENYRLRVRLLCGG
jgi:transposase